jgi:hypothetical protein
MTFEDQLHQMVAQGLVPTVECTVCEYKWCCFEGLVSLVEQIHNRPCDKCGGENKFYGTMSEL